MTSRKSVGKGNKIVFVGGIHGVGKSDICHKICEQTNLVHITASKIIKWDEISDPHNKKVDNIQSTQNRLIEELNKTLKKDKSYLLDGHFCLFNAKGEVEKISIEIFNKIAPKLIAVVTEKVDLIKERLENRDKKIYDFALLNNMQVVEMKHAQKISSNMRVPFVEIKSGNYQSLIEIIQ